MISDPLVRASIKGQLVNVHRRSMRLLSHYAAISSLLTVFILLAAGTTFSAEKNKSKLKPYSVIIGTVWDHQNRVAPGVKIKIQRVGDKKPKWEHVSDRNGEFAQRFPAGKADYVVWAEIKGKKEHVAETKVHIEDDERQDIGLHLPE